MKAGSKEKIIITLSIAILLGIGSYFGVKKLRKLKNEKAAAEAEAERLKNESNNVETPVITPSNNKVSATQTALAIAYRTWANSTDDLSKKYGKKSSYDLDATSTTPTGGTFARSYALGKNDFDNYNKSMSKPDADNSKPSAKNAKIFNAIAASTGKPVKRLANGVSYLDIKVLAQGKGLKVLKIADGQISSGTFSPSWVVYYLYDTDWKGTLTGKSIASGYLRVKNGKYDFSGANGIGKGAKITGASTLNQGLTGVLGFTTILQ